MMVRGLGAGFSSVYSHFASSSITPTASAAGSVVDGNYSYGNMQTNNVNGFQLEHQQYHVIWSDDAPDR